MSVYPEEHVQALREAIGAKVIECHELRTTLAERDRRISELEELLERWKQYGYHLHGTHGKVAQPLFDDTIAALRGTGG